VTRVSFAEVPGIVMPWFIDVVAGGVLALGLYGLVRFRMMAGPRLRDRYGSWARWAVWVLVAALMVLLANLELIALREILHSWFKFESSLAHEIIFAIVALLGGYFLVARYVRRQRKPGSPNSESDCRINK
jgi:cytochrome bd-type quinol oxidase subunit 2